MQIIQIPRWLQWAAVLLVLALLCSATAAMWHLATDEAWIKLHDPDNVRFDFLETRSGTFCGNMEGGTGRYACFKIKRLVR